MAEQYDLIVIGAGPAGYPAALKAAGMGKKVAVVDSGNVGGTCLNRGCIPTKTILHTALLYQELKQGERIGLAGAGPAIHYGKLRERKEEVVRTLQDGILKLFQKNKITLYQGSASVTPQKTVKITGMGETDRELAGGNILIATGSRPASLPIPGADLEGVLNSDGLLELKGELFASLVIIGGGVIGMEFATAYQAMGCQVTVLESMERILPGMDREISQNLKMIMKKRGAEIHTGAMVKEIVKTPEGLTCTYVEKGNEEEARADAVLIATGRRANTEGLFTDEMTPEMDRGCILVNRHFETSIPGIYAAGDVVGGVQLAHAATAEALTAVAAMFGEPETICLGTVPGCVYTDPEIACAGLTADEAKERGIQVKVCKYPMSANGKSVLSLQERGFVKVLADPASGRILGTQMMCARATDMISQFVQAIELGLTLENLGNLIYPHPTFSEAIGEAVRE